MRTQFLLAGIHLFIAGAMLILALIAFGDRADLEAAALALLVVVNLFGTFMRASGRLAPQQAGV